MTLYIKNILKNIQVEYFIKLSAFLFILGCEKTGKTDIRSYYFPLKSLTEGLVYEYKSVNNDSLTPQYWHYRSLILKDQVLLTGMNYEFDLVPKQLVKEELVNNGMLLHELVIYETDSLGKQIPATAEIQAGNIFPFKVSEEGGIFLYKIKYSLPSQPSISTTLIKNRRFMGDTSVIYKNRPVKSIIFEVRELFERADKEEGYFEQEFSGIEIYAKDIGLVYYRKEITPGFTIEYELKDQYPMAKLEDKLQKRLNTKEAF